MFRPVARSLSAALAAGLCCAPALAAPQEREARDSLEARAAAGQTAAVPDRQILSFLTPMNRMEVDLSKFAAERAVTPEVKEYAKQMVADHEKLASDLQRAARRSDAHGALTPEQRRRAEAPLRDDGAVTEEESAEVSEELKNIREERAEVQEEVAEERADLREEGRENMRERREDAREERVSTLGDAVDEAVQDAREAGETVEQDARQLGERARRNGRELRTDAREGAANLARQADQALNEDQPARGMNRGRGGANLRVEAMTKAHAAVKDELGRLNGKEFEMAYLSQQMLAHIEMLAAVQVAAAHAGPELKTVLTDAEGVIEGHLQRTRELNMRIDKAED